jgi:peptidyl-prolyl cis-trans isomerase D
MGFMEKIRSSTAPVLWVLVLAFGLLFMLQDTQVFDAVLAGPRTMGEVNGRPITSELYNQRLNAFTEQHRQQTGNPPNRE